MSPVLGWTWARIGLRAVLAVFLGLILVVAIAAGTRPAHATSSDPGTLPASQTANNDPLAVQVTETGRVHLSTDGLGTNDPAGGDIRANKPSAGATVRSAWLFGASTGGSGHTLANGDVTLAGQVVNWSLVVPSDITSSNGWADVTSIVKPALDAASAGITSFHVMEPVGTLLIDGEGLAVIWNDPAQTTDNTIVLMFGAQNPAGDDFKVLYASPINKSDPSLLLDMSLGISFGFQQPGCNSQFSTIDVNGTRISSSAGGQDDGQSENGALMTVGGIGDSDVGPADPLSSCSPVGDRQDQELYNLVPFVKDGDLSTTIHTVNPSHDDNILFAGFFLKSQSAIVGAGIVLSPPTATNVATVGTPHTLTATVQDNNGNPVIGTAVTFTVFGGPNAGAAGVCSLDVTCKTDLSGRVSFTYTSSGSQGTDMIQACFIDATNAPRCATATKTWTAPTEQQITAQGVPVSATEGQTFTAPVATFTDPNPNSTAAEYSASIDWGDGAASSGTITGLTGGPFTVTGTHTYAEEGTYNVVVTITDLDASGNSATATPTATVTDATLTAGQLSLTGGAEGSAPATASFTFTDANPASTAADFTAQINWGDTTTTTGTVTGPPGGAYTVTGSHTYAQEGPYTVTVTATDDGGSTTTATGTLNVADAALTSGQLSLLGGTEGSAAATASFTFTDANTGSTVADFTATINWGDTTTSSGTVTGPVGGPYTVTGSHTYAEEGPYTVTVTVTDDGGSTATATGTLKVGDAALTASQLSVSGGTEGSVPTNASLTFTDANPGSTLSDFTATIAWGDSTTSPGTVTGPVGGVYTVTGSHLYAEEGPYTVTVTINDVGGNKASAIGAATVADAALTGTCVVPVTASTAFAGATATFTDASATGTLSDFSATINWGDGTSSAGVITGGPGLARYTVSGTHTYVPGFYAITTTITDVGGSTVTVACSGQTFVIPPTTAGCDIDGSGKIVAANGDKAKFLVDFGSETASENDEDGGNDEDQNNDQNDSDEKPAENVQTYSDLGRKTPFTFVSTANLAATCTGKTSGSIYGTGLVNGTTPVFFIIDVTTGNAEEDGNNDREGHTAATYRIRLSNGYDSGVQNVKSGHISVHLESDEEDSEGGGRANE